MAIRDLKSGVREDGSITDYTHLLPDNLRNKGYQVKSMDWIDDPGSPYGMRQYVTLKAAHRQGDRLFEAGEITGLYDDPHLHVRNAYVDANHRDQGLGMAMYEILYRHAASMGMTRVKGGTHSSMAHAVHRKLAEKHGLSYAAPKRSPAPSNFHQNDPASWTGSFDDKYGPYDYTIKGEAKVTSAVHPNDPDIKFDNEVDEEMRLNPGISRNDAVKKVSDKRRTRPEGWFGKSERKPVIPGRYRPKYEPNLQGWMELEAFVPDAMAQSGFENVLQKHIDAASRMLGVPAELPMGNVRKLLDESDSLAAGVLEAFNAYSPENEERLETFLNDTELLKEEIPLMSGLAAYKIAPVNMEATETADAIQRAVDAGYINPVKLSGKHSKGSMLAKDPQTKTVYLLKPGSGKNSPAMGVNEDPSSQSEREACFWHVAKILGISDTLPHADLILVNGHQTAALELLPYSFHNLGERKKQDPNLPARILEPYRSNTTLFKWSLVDYILGNPDRHSQNIMVDPENKIVRLIDHGSAFAGHSFAPSEDDNSFIPFYLRAWTNKKFTRMTSQERLRYMPTLGGRAEQVFDEWVQNIDESHISEIMKDYGVDPRPALARLAKVRALPGPKWQVLNRLWAGAI